MAQDDYYNDEAAFEHIHQEVEEVIQDIKQDEKVLKKEMQVDDEVINELQDALNKVSSTQMQKFISAINKMDFDQFKQLVNNGQISKANQMLMQSAPDEETKQMLTNPEWVHEQLEVLNNAHEEIDDARQKLEKEMEWQESEVQQESEVDQTLKTIEGRYLDQLEGSIKKVEQNLVNS